MTPRSVIFDEVVLILEPFFWSNVIFKLSSIVSKVRIEVMRNSFECLLGIVTLQNYVMNSSLYSCSLRFYKARANTLPGGAKQWKFSVRQSWLLRRKWQILKITLPQKNDHRIQTPSSKLMILVSYCWKKNFIRNNGHSLFILSLVFLKSLIVSVAFFLGHPVQGAA